MVKKEGKPKRYLTEKELDEKFKRSGKCKQCGKCCKFVALRCNNSEEWIDYSKGFGDVVFIGGIAVLIVHKDCKYLVEGKCSKHDTKPEPCRQVPQPDDYVYQYVSEDCGFEFKSDEKFKMGVE